MRKTSPAKAAAASPKMNKAELEAHVAKLERTILRLRKQNAEMKQSAREEAPEPVKAAPVEAAPRAGRSKATPVKATRTRKTKAEQAVKASDSDHEDGDTSED